MPKKGGSLPICDDFKASKNQVFLDNRYPLPDAEDVFARNDQGGGTVFNKIDPSSAYLQMELTPQSEHNSLWTLTKACMRINASVRE